MLQCECQVESAKQLGLFRQDESKVYYHDQDNKLLNKVVPVV